MYCKKLGNVEIKINKKGAELKSLKYNEKEYLWPGDEKYWGKSSPVLFPFVGGLKDSAYIYKGKKYDMGRHGFARDRDFEIFEEADNYITFLLESDEESLKVYPFNFEFYITYRLKKDGIGIEYKVNNKNNEDMYFSLGAHPAFSCKETAYENYYLKFSQKENASLYKLIGANINPNPVKYFDNSDRIDLSKELFKDDALVFKNLNSNKITIKNKVNKNFVEVEYKGFPWMGIWAPIGAPFVCIEPWYGVADFYNHDGMLENKVGIERLEEGKSFEAKMNIRLGK